VLSQKKVAKLGVLASLRMYIHQLTSKNLRNPERIFIKLLFWKFQRLLDTFQFWLKSDTNNGHSTGKKYIISNRN